MMFVILESENKVHNMETFLSFISEHVFLAALFVVTLIMLVVEELRPKGSLEAADAAIMIQKGALVIDLQAKSERKRQLRNSQWVTNVQQFSWDKNKRFVMYCQNGTVSKNVAKDLRSKGFDAYFINGGIDSWQKDGFEVISIEG
jgi:rhodanese-related sulfurtransferase